MRKYIVLFNMESRYFDNYAEVTARNQDLALVVACKAFGHVHVATVIPANEYGYDIVRAYRKTKI